MGKLPFILALLAGLSLAGCASQSGSSVTLMSPDGQSMLRDSNPLDSEWTLISGKGCTIPNAPAQPVTPVVIENGRKLAGPIEAPPCDVQYAKSTGVGVGGFVGGLLSLGAGIRALVTGL